MDGAALRVFEAVARLGGMNRAAAELFTVQSNVTARIRQLEEELQATLFVRHSRGATLSPRPASGSCPMHGKWPSCSTRRNGP